MNGYKFILIADTCHNISLLNWYDDYDKFSY